MSQALQERGGELALAGGHRSAAERAGDGKRGRLTSTDVPSDSGARTTCSVAGEDCAAPMVNVVDEMADCRNGSETGWREHFADVITVKVN